MHHLIRRGEINYFLKDSVKFNLGFTQTPSSNHPCNSSNRFDPRPLVTCESQLLIQEQKEYLR